MVGGNKLRSIIIHSSTLVLAAGVVFLIAKGGLLRNLLRNYPPPCKRNFFTTVRDRTFFFRLGRGPPEINYGPRKKWTL